MIRLSPFAVAAAMVATGLSIMASSPVEAATVHVRYGDLDLATASGRALLDGRINRAARMACGIENSTLGTVEACRRESVASARETLRFSLQDQAVRLASR